MRLYISNSSKRRYKAAALWIGVSSFCMKERFWRLLDNLSLSNLSHLSPWSPFQVFLARRGSIRYSCFPVVQRTWCCSDGRYLLQLLSWLAIADSVRSYRYLWSSIWSFCRGFHSFQVCRWHCSIFVRETYVKEKTRWQLLTATYP